MKEKVSDNAIFFYVVLNYSLSSPAWPQNVGLSIFSLRSHFTQGRFAIVMLSLRSFRPL